MVVDLVAQKVSMMVVPMAAVMAVAMVYSLVVH